MHRSGSHAYLLDRRYEGLLSPDELVLRDILWAAGTAARTYGGSDAAEAVLKVLARMGFVP